MLLGWYWGLGGLEVYLGVGTYCWIQGMRCLRLWVTVGCLLVRHMYVQ